MSQNPSYAHSLPARRKPLGLSVPALLGLATLGVPRVVLHDLHIIDEGAPLTWLLALGPIAVWIIVALVKRVPNPFLTLLVVGAMFGAMLVITHQLLWDSAFFGDAPSVAGSTLLPRLAAIPSGLFTGTIIGVLSGLAAWGLQAVSNRRAVRK